MSSQSLNSFYVINEIHLYINSFSLSFAWIWCMHWSVEKKSNINAHITYNMISAHFCIVIIICRMYVCTQYTVHCTVYTEMYSAVFATGYDLPKEMFNLASELFSIYGCQWYSQWYSWYSTVSHAHNQCEFTLNFAALNPIYLHIFDDLSYCYWWYAYHGPVKIYFRAYCILLLIYYMLYEVYIKFYIDWTELNRMKRNIVENGKWKKKENINMSIEYYSRFDSAISHAQFYTNKILQWKS